ncbi:pyridoxamine 5'-phosphate oxidase family protein [Corynebacterium bovis]|uniref:Pyridoxamine 5'-phosphate oxidase N-terminal domain-containing protein n=1 Tax=Corynebacterium bovis DSM 20582 = CIP 54.80 TaxID=927655 RepID=A0A8H9YCF2_9CORY|nr:pyridoxamine 5'-phosphate oxidase family protein [Corynebacterium bovis]MBB3116079.1 hypothetical protein [Corynebacterium bovis DSM 20582 = CIP 54.80]QQC47014.1 pyridoxamine 5'-phosphate oxidase family protein [Corynebacterium bovis]WJY76665.1 Pyridoxamine 5'-phosphate oxidase [Corynebacterium bovis DSM 20582 = CIP 54.80]
MARLTEQMKDMIDAQLPFLATVTDAESLTPDIGPKRTLRVWDDETLIYNENTARQHLANLLEGSRAAVAVVDWDALDGYRFIGRAKVLDEGPAWDDCVRYAEDRGWNPPRKAVLIHIEQIYTLMLGKNAGTLLASDDPTDDVR